MKRGRYMSENLRLCWTICVSRDIECNLEIEKIQDCEEVSENGLGRKIVSLGREAASKPTSQTALFFACWSNPNPKRADSVYWIDDDLDCFQLSLQRILQCRLELPSCTIRKEWLSCPPMMQCCWSVSCPREDLRRVGYEDWYRSGPKLWRNQDTLQILRWTIDCFAFLAWRKQRSQVRQVAASRDRKSTSRKMLNSFHRLPQAEKWGSCN